MTPATSIPAETWRYTANFVAVLDEPDATQWIEHLGDFEPAAVHCDEDLDDPHHVG